MICKPGYWSQEKPKPTWNLDIKGNFLLLATVIELHSDSKLAETQLI